MVNWRTPTMHCSSDKALSTPLASSFNICCVTFLFFAVFLSGCGHSNEATVRGIVTLDGKPLSRGVVTFHPVQGGDAPRAQIEANGSYEIYTGSRRGLISGEYVVTVVALEPMTRELAATMSAPKRIAPARYANKTTSDFRMTVQPGANTLELALKP